MNETPDKPQIQGIITIKGIWEKSGYPSVIDMTIKWDVATTDNGAAHMTRSTAINIANDLLKTADTWKWI